MVFFSFCWMGLEKLWDSPHTCTKTMEFSYTWKSSLLLWNLSSPNDRASRSPLLWNISRKRDVSFQVVELKSSRGKLISHFLGWFAFYDLTENAQTAGFCWCAKWQPISTQDFLVPSCFSSWIPSSLKPYCIALTTVVRQYLVKSSRMGVYSVESKLSSKWWHHHLFFYG